MHPSYEWHVTWEDGRPIWLRILNAEAANGDVVSLAVWSVPGSCTWEWEVLVTSDDMHVRGDVASSREEAMAAVEAAYLAIFAKANDRLGQAS